YGTNSKILAGFQTRPWRDVHKATGQTFTDVGFQNCWDSGRLQSKTRGLLTNFTGGQHGVEVGQDTAAVQAAEFVGQLEVVYPGVRTAYAHKTARFHWPSHAHSLGSYACYAPGQYTTIRGAEGQR